jgi:hypothetical protein
LTFPILIVLGAVVSFPIWNPFPSKLLLTYQVSASSVALFLPKVSVSVGRLSLVYTEVWPANFAEEASSYIVLSKVLTLWI